MTTTPGGRAAPPEPLVPGAPSGAPGAVDGDDAASAEDVAPDEPPPPPVGPPPPPAPSPGHEQVLAALTALVDGARLGLAVALGVEAMAAAEEASAEHALAEVGADLRALRREERAALVELGRQRRRVRRWAIEAYTGGSLRPMAYVLESEHINDVPRRLGLAGGAFAALGQSLGRQEDALARAVEESRSAALTRDAVRRRLAAARDAVVVAAAEVEARRREVAALDVGRTAGAGGVAFPVAGPARFSDTFGAPRMAGTGWAHAHQGVDIFAPPGAAVVAFESGTVSRLGADVLGGTRLWLVGRSGARYYYAHLQGYAPGLAAGQVVEVGQTLAYVGNTGNARTTPHHLHFEIHPAGGPVVNPAPLLARILDVTAAVGAGSAPGGPPPGTVVRVG